MSADIEAKIASAIERYGLLDGVKSVLVGFSGGADSTVLLTFLSRVGDIKVYAAHVNHMIRGAEADRDEEFAREYCRKLGVTFFSERIDVPGIAKEKGLGIEETARNERYGYFDRLCRENGIDAVAVAHNADDNAETVLINLCRGSGLNGLSGIKPKRGNIIRPLILCKKQDIVLYCRENGISYVTDSTNADSSYTRNYVRNEVIPMLKKLNPNLIDSVTRMTESVCEDENYLSSEAGRHSFEEGRKALSELSAPLLHRVIRSECEKNGCHPENGHIRETAELITSDVPKTGISLPGGRLVCDRDSVYFAEEDGNEGETELNHGLTETPYGTVFVTEKGENADKIAELKNIYNSYIAGSFTCDIINKTLTVGARRPGDSVKAGRMTKKLKKLIQEKKLTEKEKKKTAVFRLDGEVVWVPGICVSDRIRPVSGGNTEIYIFGEKKR